MLTKCILATKDEASVLQGCEFGLNAFTILDLHVHILILEVNLVTMNSF